jgi:hypothetical protein
MPWSKHFRHLWLISIATLVFAVPAFAQDKRVIERPAAGLRAASPKNIPVAPLILSSFSAYQPVQESRALRPISDGAHGAQA